MPYPSRLLNDNEEIILDLRPHPIAIAIPTLIAVGALAFGIFAVVVENQVLSIVALLVIAVALVYFVAKVLGWSRTMFVVTTDRIISRKGVLTKSGVEFPLERINTVFFNQRFIERMVGAGDLAIESASERGTEHFSNVRRPETVQREIYVQIEANENRKFDRMGERTRGGGSGLSTAEQLEKLHELLSKGAITPEQYEAERSKVLGA